MGQPYQMPKGLKKKKADSKKWKLGHKKYVKAKPKQIGRKKEANTSQGLTEKGTFEKVLLGRNNGGFIYCEVDNCTRYKIDEVIPAWCFSHVLCKKDYPQHKFNHKNIIFVGDIECHEKVDKLTIGKKRQILEELESGNRITYNFLESLQS